MSSTQGTIVVGVDGSPASKRVLHWAARQAAAERRGLTLVHTVHAVTLAHLDGSTLEPDTDQELLQQGGRTILEAAGSDAARWAPGIEVGHVLGVADPRDLLVWMSETAAMVVVGSRGRGPLRSAVLGSVGVALVRHAQCPVVVVRPGNIGRVRNGIVAGVDALPESGPVLEFSYAEASVRDLPLTVVHAGEDAESGRLALAEAIAGMGEKYPDVTVTTRLTQGPALDELVRVGKRMDLIVVGSHQAGGLDRVRRPSVAVAVVEHASCPVAVVPVHS